MSNAPTLTVERTTRKSAVTRRRTSPTKRKQYLAAYLFLLPFFVVFITMLVIPLVYAGYLSLFESKLIGGEVFAGLDNYARALTDPQFLGSLGRVGLFFIVQVPIMLGLALFFALALDTMRARGSEGHPTADLHAVRRARGRRHADVGLPLRPGLRPDRPDRTGGGPRHTGLPVARKHPLLDDEHRHVGVHRLQHDHHVRGPPAIPGELYEAAEIDGAGQFRLAWSIKIPAIRPAIMLTVIFSIIGSFQLFAEPSLLNTIAPTAITNSFTPNYYAYNLAFINQELNYAAAVAFLLGLVIAVISYFVQLGSERSARRERKGL